MKVKPDANVRNTIRDDDVSKHNHEPKVPSLNIRTSATSRGWDQAVGSAIDMIPQSKLPTKRIILRRYRAMRMLDPYEKMSKLASKISEEVLSIWGRAPKIPIQHKNTVSGHVSDIIKKHCDTAPASKCLNADYQASLDELFNICTTTLDVLQKKMTPDHQVDYDFFVGMLQNPQVGSITTTTDTVLLKKNVKAENRKRKYQEFQTKNARYEFHI